MRYQCSAPSCDRETASHYCTDHRRHCSECGNEWSAAELIDGKCRECHRIDNSYAFCSCAYCVEAA